MPRLIGALVAIAFFVAAGLSEPANAEGTWVLVKSSGDVRVASQRGAWHPTSTRHVLQPGDVVSTGPGGRALLQNDSASLALPPRSQIEISTTDPDETIIFQHQGQLSVNVNRKPREHFSVHTPYLATVVKGTRFAVTIGDESTVVAVFGGIVRVVDKDTGQAVFVHPGQAVATENRPGAGLTGQMNLNDSSLEAMRAAADSGALSGVGTAVTEVAQTSGGLVGGAAGTAGGVAGGVTTAAENLASSAGSSASGVGNAAGGAAGSVSSAVSSAVGQAGGTVGGLF